MSFPPPRTDTDEVKLHHLFESTLELRRQEREHFLQYCDELTKEPNKKMDVASLEFGRPRTSVSLGPQIEISFTCSSPDVLKMLMLTLDCARSKLSLSKTMFEFCDRVVSLALHSKDIERVLAFLKPLIRRTRFGEVKFTKIPSDISKKCTALLTTCDELSEPLQKLIESVIEHHNDETSQFLGHWVKLKGNPRMRLTIRHFLIKDESDSKGANSVTSIGVRSTSSFVIWNALIKAAFSHLKIRNISYAMHSLYQKQVSLKMGSDNVAAVFNFLKPATTRTRIYNAAFSRTSAKNIDLFSDFLKCGALRTLIHYAYRDTNFTAVLNFVRKMRPKVVTYYRSGNTQEIAEFLLPLSDLVDVINVWESYFTYSGLSPIPLSAIREIMLRKCKYLAIRAGPTRLSLSDTEGLLKLFHHLKKKVAVKITSGSEPMSTKVGEYNVEINRITVLIEHDGMNPPLE